MCLRSHRQLCHRHSWKKLIIMALIIFAQLTEWNNWGSMNYEWGMPLKTALIWQGEILQKKKNEYWNEMDVKRAKKGRFNMNADSTRNPTRARILISITNTDRHPNVLFSVFNYITECRSPLLIIIVKNNEWNNSWRSMMFLFKVTVT